MEGVKVKLRQAMERKGVSEAAIEQIVAAISSFALYGFPESHAISFALIAYASAFLKVHYAAEFYAGLLNNQPMGFYSPGNLGSGCASPRFEDPSGLCDDLGLGVHDRVGFRAPPWIAHG